VHSVKELEAQFFCDGTHLTTAADLLISEECSRSLTPPLRINSIAAAQTALGDLTLRWPRGSVPSQLEWTPDLQSGQWQPLGKPNSLSETTVKRASSPSFFRVLFLGQ